MKHPDNIEQSYGLELFLLAFFIIAGYFIVFMVIFHSEPTPAAGTKENILVNEYGSPNS